MKVRGRVTSRRLTALLAGPEGIESGRKPLTASPEAA